jgi:alpha-L-fucosidase
MNEHTGGAPVPEPWRWFEDARFGMFIHWGPYTQFERGEQVLFREHLDQNEYAQAACGWNPRSFDARAWADAAARAGCRYAVLTTRHHDGFCLWDTQTTDYSSAAQAAKRDFVREYVEAFRAAGLRVGLYYSLADWRIPAYWEGPRHDAAGWEGFKSYCHEQVRELLSNYGQIDVVWFDGTWPRNARAWESEKLVAMMRQLQPDILINNRLDAVDPEEGVAQWQQGAVENAGDSKKLGDFGTPEHHITPEKERLWESCQVTTWRLWGYARGERVRPFDVLLDFLCESASKGGNLLLNVGPDAQGRIPASVQGELDKVGDWLQVHGEAIYGTRRGDVTEFVTRGWQTTRGNDLFLILRFWDGSGQLRLPGLAPRVLKATLLTTSQELPFEQDDETLTVRGLPLLAPCEGFPVVKIECDAPPSAMPAFRDRLWCGDPKRMTAWARSRGTSVWADGQER